jgi:hypothetical protein
VPLPPLPRILSRVLALQVSSILGVPTSDDAAINAYGALFTARINASLSLARGSAGPNGAFVDSCLHHTRGWTEYGVGAETQASAFERWYTGRGGSGGGPWWQQSKAYPCKVCCGNASSGTLALGSF